MVVPGAGSEVVYITSTLSWMEFIPQCALLLCGIYYQ
jgi:hypothetical protein